MPTKKEHLISQLYASPKHFTGVEVVNFIKEISELPEQQKDLFGGKIPNTYFVGCSAADDGGFMMAHCGKENKDNGANYVVTTTGLHADQIPDECTDAKTFAELVAKLLNEYYNK